MWYRFRAYNTPAVYGWTQNPAVAEAYHARLNQGRDVNLYTVEEMTQDEERVAQVAAMTDIAFDDDTTLDDVGDDQ